MNIKGCTVFAVFLLAGPWLSAQEPPHDPLTEHLVPPELVMQNQEKLGLSEAQKTFIMDEVKKAQDRLSEEGPKHQKELEALAALLKQKPVDETQAQAQLDKVLNQEREIKKLHIGLMVRIQNKLTPEQQAQVWKLNAESAGAAPPGKPDQAALTRRFHSKVETIKAGVQKLQDAGKPPFEIVEIMEGFRRLMEEGKVKEADALLDRALKVLTEKESGKNQDTPTNPGPSRNLGESSKGIDWQKDLEGARKLASQQKKLVLQFLMLGDLTDPDC